MTEATIEDIKRILRDDHIELEIFEAWFKHADERFPYGLYHNLKMWDKNRLSIRTAKRDKQ